MFHLKRKIETWSHCNTDINYLKEKNNYLEELIGVKDRILTVICDLDESFKYQHISLINLLNEPFFPKNIANYSQEIQEHFVLLRKLEKEFDILFVKTMDSILNNFDLRSTTLKYAIKLENFKIQECKNKYPESSSLILIKEGIDVLQEEELARQVLLKFQSSMDYTLLLRNKSYKR